MADISIPPYKPLIKNKAFERRVEPMDHPIMGRVDLTEILELHRLTCPRQDDIIASIQANAQKLDLAQLKAEQHESGFSERFQGTLKIQDLLKMFPAEEVGHIAEGDANSLRHLRKHYPSLTMQEGREYVEAKRTIVPTQNIDVLRRDSGFSFLGGFCGANETISYGI